MHTKEITTQNFTQHVDREGIVLIDWWASWCGPCRAFSPIFEAAATRHPDITWGKVDTDAQQQLSGAFAIRSLPTLMAFRDGILLFEQPGLLRGEALDQLVQKLKALDMDDIRRRMDQKSESAGGSQS